MKFKTLLLLCLIICFNISVCHDLASGTEEMTKDSGKLILPSNIPPLPAFEKEPHPCDFLTGDETYELILKPMADSNITVSNELWIHRVVKELPGNDLEKVKQLAKQMAFEGQFQEVSPNIWTLKEPPGRFAYFTFPEDVRIQYESAAWQMADGIFTSEQYHKLNKNLSEKKMYSLGIKALQKMGLLPSNLTNSYTCVNIQRQGKWLLRRIFQCHGELEGYPLTSPRMLYRFSVTLAGELASFEIMGWMESERYAYLQCKTIPEAFAALNNGHALPLPKKVAGCTAEYLGTVYIPGYPGAKFIYPFYIFGVESKKIQRFEAYVPAIKEEYFENPKQQIVFRKMP